MPDEEQSYVITTSRVREAIDTLLARETHQFFPAYLYLRQLAAREGRTTGLAPQWTELGSILDVPGGPPNKPYLRPFWPRARTAHQEWLASNLAGSYSPSSLRAGQPPTRVVETDAAGRYILKENHWELALEHLLMGVKMPALALATFVFRNNAFVTPTQPDVGDIVTAFVTEFGYEPDGLVEFHTLYDNEWQGTGDAPWFELAPEDENA